MSMRRVLAAAAALLAIVYVRMCMPEAAQKLMPALSEITAQEQLILRLPESAASWLRLS